MVQKTSSQKRSYDIDATKKVACLVWHPEDDDGEQGNLPDVRVPLRLKMGLLLDIAGDRTMDNQVMLDLLDAVIPETHRATLRLMDVNDFQDMFTTWQTEYNTLTGGSLGESAPSAGSSSSTAEPSSTTSEPVSV